MRMFACSSRVPSCSAEKGLSLIELLIALGIGLFMLTGIISLVVSVSQTRVELDKTSEQIENGRYALQVLSDDLRNAGFYGIPQPEPDVYSTPTPCATSATIGNLEFGYLAAQATVPVPVYGYAAGSILPTCLSSPVTGSEALVVRQVGTTDIAAATLSNTNSVPYVQVSANKDDTATLAVGKIPADFSLRAKDGSTAKVRAYSVRTYYLDNCDDCSNSGDGIPTLKVAELINGVIPVTPTPLVEGIEDMHIEYGLDMVGIDNTSLTHDGSPDCYVTDPGVATAPTSCGAGTWATASPNNWVNVTSVRIHLLARSTQPTASWTDTSTYDLGRTNSLGNPVRSGPFNDQYKRQVYTTVVTLNNVRGRRE